MKRNNSQKIKLKDLLVFTKALSILFKSGIPLVQGLQTIRENYSGHYFATLLTQISVSLNNGLTLSESFGKYPHVFSDIYCAFIRAGEQSGSLELIFTLIVQHLETIQQFKDHLIKALIYPAIILSVSLLVSLILAFCVIPEFQTIYQNMGAQLPLFTLVVIHIINMIKTHFILILSIFLLIYSYYKTSKTMQLKVIQMLTQLPILSALLKKMTLARFCKTLKISFTAGLPLTTGLQLALKTVHNPCYAKALTGIGHDLTHGTSLYAAMHKTQMFPKFVIQMIRIGEESGALEQCLENVVAIFEDEIQQTIATINTLIEPIIITFIGFFLGILLLALYLPMFKLGGIF